MKKNRRWTISVIIPTKNRPDSLRRTLSALNMQTPRVNEVVVVDTSIGTYQAKTKRVVDLFVSLGARYRDVPYASASKARNYGIKRSVGDILAFLDDDAVPQAGWVRAIQEAANVGPFWFRGQTTDASESGAIVHRVYTFYKELTSQDFKRQWSSYRRFKGYQLADLIQAGNFFVRRDTLMHMDPVFDEHLFPFIAEGTDLSLRIRQSGGQILYVPKAKVRHYFLRLGYGNFVLHEAFWYGRALAIFYKRSQQSLAALGPFGKTVSEKLKRKKAAHFWKLMREGYTLFRTKYAKNKLYNFLFLFTCACYLLFLGLGFLYGVLEYFGRIHRVSNAIMQRVLRWTSILKEHSLSR